MHFKRNHGDEVLSGTFHDKVIDWYKNGKYMTLLTVFFEIKLMHRSSSTVILGRSKKIYKKGEQVEEAVFKGCGMIIKSLKSVQ